MSLPDLFATFRFWLVLNALGTAGSLFAYRLFHKLPDKGWAFSKMTGLVMTTFIFWLMTSYGLTSNTVGSIIFALIVFVGLSVWLYQQTDQGLWRFIQDNIGYVVTAELIFTLLFFVWAFVRAQNPQIINTEKPMEFAFLNAVTHSPTYPPLDPWLSGFAISYYYMGYIMMSLVGRLAAVQMAITFNLAIAWLVAGAGIGAFGIVYNLVMLLAPSPAKITAALKRNAIILAVVASVALPLAGNNQMLMETLHGNGIGSENLWAWLDIQDINGAPAATPRFLNSEGTASSIWWWWRSSRVIKEYNLSGNNGLEPIAEFPGFSFVLGDMHPHVLALPYIFLITALALSWYLDDRDWQPPDPEKSVWIGWADHLVKNLGWEKLLTAAVLLGGLAFTNTWDLPIHLFVLLGAFALNRWRATGRFDSGHLAETASIAITLILLIFAIYYPFFSGLNSQAGSPYILPMLVQPTRLAHFLVIFGTPIFVILILLGSLIWRQRSFGGGKLPPALYVGAGLPIFLIVLALFLTMGIAASQFGAGFYNGIANELGLVLPARSGAPDFGWGVAFVKAILPIYFTKRFTYFGVTLLLSTLLGGVVWLWTGQLTHNRPEDGERQPAAVLPFLLLLIFTGTLLALGPEYVYLKDNFGQRINTIFKFYYQVWILFGVSALVSIGYLWQHHKPAGWLTAGVYAILFVFAIRFPIIGAQSRAIEYRGALTANVRRTPTLNGLVFMQNQNISDYEAVQWLLNHATPNEVVLETTGGAYSYYGRVSANTGLPTLLGWAGHEYQWRGDSTDQVGIRSSVVREIYDTRDWNHASNLLNQYDVTYIYVGDLERKDHDAQGLEKFANNLEIAYENGGVVIYRWQ